MTIIATIILGERTRAARSFRDVTKALGIYPSESGGRQLLGDECPGTVVALGDGVEGFAIGDRVAGYGAFVLSGLRRKWEYPKRRAHLHLLLRSKIHPHLQSAPLSAVRRHWRQAPSIRYGS
jgi:hypothetical protein